MSTSTNQDQKTTATADLQHFLKLATAQVRHRIKQTESAKGQEAKLRSLLLLEDLLKEQDQLK